MRSTSTPLIRSEINVLTVALNVGRMSGLSIHRAYNSQIRPSAMRIRRRRTASLLANLSTNPSGRSTSPTLDVSTNSHSNSGSGGPTGVRGTLGIVMAFRTVGAMAKEQAMNSLGERSKARAVYVVGAEPARIQPPAGPALVRGHEEAAR